MSSIPIFPAPTIWSMNDVIADTHALRGVPICAVQEIDEVGILHGGMNSFEDYIKVKLVNVLAQEILKNRLAEFTKMEDYIRGTTIYRARAFLLCDADVQLLRLQRIIK